MYYFCNTCKSRLLRFSVKYSHRKNVTARLLRFRLEYHRTRNLQLVRFYESAGYYVEIRSTEQMVPYTMIKRDLTESSEESEYPKFKIQIRCNCSGRIFSGLTGIRGWCI